MRSITTSIFLMFLVLVFVSHESNASPISITNFSLTTRGVSFEISGQLPNDPPPSSNKSIFFVNSNVAADPGYALGLLTEASSITFTGSQSVFAARTGNPSYGDYFLITFLDTLTSGENIVGSFTATWNVDAFVPTQVTNINVYWGTDSSLPVDPKIQPSVITGGTYLTSIPEPSTTILLLGGSVLAFTSLRLMKKVKQYFSPPCDLIDDAY